MALPLASGPRPPWLKVQFKHNENFHELKVLMRGLELHTVCEEALCPNIHECWNARTATFMILGDVCTRHCTFCAVAKGEPRLVDEREPENVAEAVEQMGLRHAVITSVNRDDLPDGGAEHFAQVIHAVRRRMPECAVEVLIPDFQGDWEALRVVLEARPEVLAHNTETVKALYKRVRPNARYEQSLELILRAAEWRDEHFSKMLTKSGLMLGIGEDFDQIIETMQDLAESRCDVLTLGQYLQPTRTHHLPVARFVSLEEFDRLRERGKQMGFGHVEAGPLVRSSYHASHQLDSLTNAKG